MKILYASGLSLNDSSLYRLWALERLGHQVIPFNSFDYVPRNPILRKATFRLSAGPAVDAPQSRPSSHRRSGETRSLLGR